jgi:hypothetical protein
MRRWFSPIGEATPKASALPSGGSLPSGTSRRYALAIACALRLRSTNYTLFGFAHVRELNLESEIEIN